jgi:hypothetical protein
MDYQGTSVFVTKDEIETIQAAGFNSTAARFGPRPGRSQNEIVHEMALSHGLKDISGFYGKGTKGRDSVKYEGQN